MRLFERWVGIASAHGMHELGAGGDADVRGQERGFELLVEALVERAAGPEEMRDVRPQELPGLVEALLETIEPAAAAAFFLGALEETKHALCSLSGVVAARRERRR